MAKLLSLLSKFFSFLASLALFILQIIKYIFTKLWKFILIIGGLLLSLIGIKKARNKETKQ